MGFMDKMKNVISNVSNTECNIKIGTIVSGDIFCTDVNMKNKIREECGADAIDMESASIAQVCYLDRKPFIIIRSISDKPISRKSSTNRCELKTFVW